MEHRKPLKHGLISTTTLICGSLISLFPISALGQTVSDQSISGKPQPQPLTETELGSKIKQSELDAGTRGRGDAERGEIKKVTENQLQQPSPVENQPAPPIPSTPSTPTESQPQRPSPVENQPAPPLPSKPSTPVPEKQDDELFQRIFGRPRTSGSVQTGSCFFFD